LRRWVFLFWRPPMALEEKLALVIAEEAQKLSLRYHAYHNALELEVARKRKRTSKAVVKDLKTPEVWNKDRKFNPFYVHKRRFQIARALAKKIRTGTYAPNPPEFKSVPKSSGGVRQVTIYQIPDQAVSRLIYQQLLRKNRHRFSSFAYAYRDDRNVHFAIQ